MLPESSSTTHEISPLCYAKMKTHYPKIVKSMLEAVTPKRFVVISIHLTL